MSNTIETNKVTSDVFNMDCVEYMRTLPDNFFDIAICDPPYGDADSGDFQFGENTSTNNRLRFHGGDRWERYYKPTGIHTQGENVEDKVQKAVNHAYGCRFSRYSVGQSDSKLQRIDWDVAPQQEFFDELFRVSKNQVIWGGNYFFLPPTRCFLVWRKLSISEKFSMAMCEYAWTSFKGNAKLFESVPQRGKYSGKFHPTEKPIALYNWILDLFAKDGDKIFDPMMGSQSSRCAAFLSGYDYCGCEIDEYYFNKGNEFFERICHGVDIDEKGNKIIQTKLFYD